MIWLASYPRSGNTFFRNVLFEVYGIASSEFHNEAGLPLRPDYDRCPAVKTHLLPSQLRPSDRNIPAVYLVRDGRDCVVSLAHYRRQLHGDDADYELCLREAIDAAGGSYFGGWSRHVREWTERASLVIRFEELIADPIACVERMRPLLELPEPRIERLPTFESQKACLNRYGRGEERGLSGEASSRWSAGMFRRGKVGAWQDELPHKLHLRFISRHGSELFRLGYEQGSPQTKTVAHRSNENSKPRAVRLARRARTRVLIDGSKLLDERIDGIHRYVHELLAAIEHVVTTEDDSWEIDVALANCGHYPLREVVAGVDSTLDAESHVPRLLRTDERNPLLQSKRRMRTYRATSAWRFGLEFLNFKRLSLMRSVLKRYFRIRSKLFGAAKQYDLLHLTLPNTWQHYRSLPFPVLTTVHDLSHLACPELQTESNVETLRRGLEWAASRKSRYISVSQSTKEQMIESLGCAADRIEVVHNAVCHEQFIPEGESRKLRAVREKYRIPGGPFLLCLGTIEPRKNLTNIIRAFQSLVDEHPERNLNLVVAGGHGWENQHELNQQIQNCSRIRRIGYVDDHDLPALYSAATALCYVSLYEGFGLPILEAMACGTAVIYGGNSSMPEIAGNAGIAARADDPADIKTAMLRIVSDELSRRDMEFEAVLRSRDMTWTRAARETLRAYRSAIDTAGDRRNGGKTTAIPAPSASIVIEEPRHAA